MEKFLRIEPVASIDQLQASQLAKPNSLVKSRRSFMTTVGATGIALCGNLPAVHSFHSNSSNAESVIGELYETLSESQRSVVSRSFDHPTRQTLSANWHVSKPLIGSDFYSDSQRHHLNEILRKLTSRTGHELLSRQLEDDDGGLDAFSVAWFGKPGDSQFEWMLTGRHLTLRADGNTQKQIAFGGPIVYGHGEESSPEANLYYFQTVKFNKVFDSLSSDQKSRALLNKSIPSEAKARIDYQPAYEGLPASQLTDEQFALFSEALASILGVYREEDVKEAHEILDAAGGMRSLNLQYFAEDDLQNDGIWDMWKIVNKNASIHFRGAPHVHAFVHIQASCPTEKSNSQSTM